MCRCVKDTSSVDKKVAGRDFETVKDLAKFVNPLIDEADEPARKPSSPSGGNKSSGGGAFRPITAEPSVSAPDVNQAESVNKFGDLSGYDWAKEAIANLAKSGIVSGKGNGVFDPGANVVREEFTKMIVKMFDLKGNSETKFDD
ncbi:MAG: S-layer homology domain-containing protein, partial [bacterium]|nr:S-layer homology domain-containing protein [bacterium]